MDSLEDSQATEQIAADWLAKRDSGAWTEADETAFSAWQRVSMTHRVAVIRLKTIWQHADRLQALGAGVPPGSIPSAGQWRVSSLFDRGSKATASRTSPLLDEDPELESPCNSESGTVTPFRGIAAIPRTRHLRALAAGIAIALFAGLAAYSGYFFANDPDTYRTAVGESQAVHLADGSQVTLNTDSRIQVALTASERRIELSRGEVFFDVAKDPSRPFVVQAGDKRVVAVGTKFSVLRLQNDLRVVVTEGAVRVEDSSRANVEPPVQLDAGDIASAGPAGVLVTAATIPQAEQALSWRSGYIVLRDTPLAEAVAEFNRYNERQLVIDDPQLADLRIGGNLRLTNLDAFVRVLEQGFPIEAHNQDDRIVLTRR